VISTARPLVAPQPVEDVEDLRLDDHVERGRGLVGDHQLRLQHDRQRDHDPLAHPAGELVRVVVDPRRRDAHLRERRDRHVARLVLGDVRAVGADRLGEVGADLHQGSSRVIGSWKISAI
jgi:hypothetical protein